MLSHIKLTGNLKVSVHDYIRDSWEVVCDDKNLIVTSGLGVVPSLLTLNEIFTDVNLTETKKKRLHSIRMGSSQVDTASTYTNLVTPIIGYELAAVDIVLLGASFTISRTMPLGEGNGTTFREAALFTKGDYSAGDPISAPELSTPQGTMFARKTHAGVAKTGLIQIRYDWTISLAAG